MSESKIIILDLGSLNIKIAAVNSDKEPLIFPSEFPASDLSFNPFDPIDPQIETTVAVQDGRIINSQRVVNLLALAYTLFYPDQDDPSTQGQPLTEQSEADLSTQDQSSTSLPKDEFSVDPNSQLGIFIRCIKKARSSNRNEMLPWFDFSQSDGANPSVSPGFSATIDTKMALKNTFSKLRKKASFNQIQSHYLTTESLTNLGALGTHTDLSHAVAAKAERRVYKLDIKADDDDKLDLLLDFQKFFNQFAFVPKPKITITSIDYESFLFSGLSGGKKGEEVSEKEPEEEVKEPEEEVKAAEKEESPQKVANDSSFGEFDPEALMTEQEKMLLFDVLDDAQNEEEDVGKEAVVGQVPEQATDENVQTNDVVADDESALYNEGGLRIVFQVAPFISLTYYFELALMAFQFFSATFVQFQTPGYFTSLFESRRTAVVVDVGHDLTTVISVCEGVVIPAAVIKSTLAGSAIDFLYSSFANVSFTDARLEKEKSFKVSPVPITTFNIDDPEFLSVFCPECLFNPETFSIFSPDEPRISAWIECPSIFEQISMSIKSSPLDYRKQLWDSIIVTGGTSKLPGFKARLLSELKIIAPAKVDLLFEDDPILSNLQGAALSLEHAFGIHWLHYDEFSENPDSLVEKFSLLEKAMIDQATQ